MGNSEAPLELLRDRLLVQCPVNHAVEAARVAAIHGGGLVITGGGAIEKARELRNTGFSGPILCDADQYVGAKRRLAGRGITPGWCERQREISGIALTDSGFVGSGDTAGLRCILKAAASRPAPTIALLP